MVRIEFKGSCIKAQCIFGVSQCFLTASKQVCRFDVFRIDEKKFAKRFNCQIKLLGIEGGFALLEEIPFQPRI